MGIKERQERDREAVRRAILDAARELFVHEGFNNISIRKIAELIEYSPAAIYGYFPSKDDIYYALAEEGFRLLLHGEDRGRTAATVPPLERVREIFWRFYIFSKEHPQYFALMFVDRSVPRISREYERFSVARELKAELTTQLQEAARAGDLPDGLAPEVVFRIISSALIGVAVMRLSDRLAPGEDADALAGDALDVTIAGLQAGLPLRSALARCAVDEAQTLTHDARVS